PQLSGHFLSPLQSHCPQAAPASWHQWWWTSFSVSDNGDVVPQVLVAQCGTRTVSLAGWWLVAASRAQQHLRYPPSSISLHPEQHVGTGTNVTISCWNKDYGATFLLHKDGSSEPIQRQDSSGGDTATFTLFGVTPADSGTYRCSYRPWHYAFMSSPLGDSVMLEVTPTPAPPGAAGSSRGNLVVAVVGGCTAALVFILVLIIFFLLSALRRRTQRDESPGAPPKKPETMEFQVPSSDSEGLTYLELQAVTPSTQPPSPPAAPQPSVIYTEVAVGGRH
uniref:Ig-like domain-containing protein n=1 Tax=Gallus gallus TaxID=9031 RepID=A0A8V0X4Y7_CHICK